MQLNKRFLNTYYAPDTVLPGAVVQVTALKMLSSVNVGAPEASPSQRKEEGLWVNRVTRGRGRALAVTVGAQSVACLGGQASS